MGPVSPRPSLRLRLTHGTPTVPTVPTPPTTEATEATDTHTLIMVSTTARGLLMLNPRPLPLPRLILPSSTPVPTVPILMPTLVSTTDMPDTTLDTLDTHMLIMVSTTARGLLMLSLRLRPRLMLTTATTATVPGPTTLDTMVLATDHT